MSNNKENLLLSIEEFLCSEEKCMFITGTHQYRKHIMVMAALDHLKPKSHILLLIYTLSHKSIASASSLSLSND